MDGLRFPVTGQLQESEDTVEPGERVFTSWFIFQTLQQPLTAKWTLSRSDIFSCVKLGFHNVTQDLTVLFCCWLHDSMYP
ncbi:hypothetical protein DUI87_07150 [Hirundo rustica rustica]|uniref:Uncharacterized protein n=1 Tax=Hirundo rustica rustica TaxID=333673 RepID=A0A3M0KQT7_HIRRU|nr:hypothetical protein DUI87_07150 [Hirundo rustica rustica]